MKLYFKFIKSSVITIVILALNNLLLTGCTVHINKDRNIGGFGYIESDNNRVGTTNFDVLKNKYGREWAQNRSNKNAPPLLGLALSGGGMRSAAFNIGVLKGLYDKGILSKVDIMSAVSGGSYAMSWYYLQQYNSMEDEKAIFDPAGRFQKHLENNGNLITHSGNWIMGPEYLIKTTLNLASMPFHWIFNGIFNFDWNLAPNRMFYENGIEREFHLTPDKNSDGFINNRSILGITVGVKKEVTFPEIRKFIEKRNLPSFIINTTAKISDSMDHYSSDFTNSIFEFTPYWSGSDAFGYHQKFPVNISRAISISGAAADSTVIPSPLMGKLFSAINLDLGYNISNYNVAKEDILLHKILPFPFYQFYRDLNDIRGASIYLSDGGHSENLGAFSLVRRLCKNLIIVDAEHDPDYQFEGYKKLKKRLRSELNVNFNVPDFDSGLFLFDTDIKKQAALHEGIISIDLLKDFNKNGILLSEKSSIDYVEGLGEWIVYDNINKNRYSVIKGQNKLEVYKMYDGSKPVVNGTISWFPYKNSDGSFEKISINVTYIKLSINKNILKSYPGTVRGYHKNSVLDEGWIFKNDPFPQQKTSDITYDKKQFSAYRDLGYHIVTKYIGKSKFQGSL